MSTHDIPAEGESLGELVGRIREALEHYAQNRHGERETARSMLRLLPDLEEGIREQEGRIQVLEAELAGAAKERDEALLIIKANMDREMDIDPQLHMADTLRNVFKIVDQAVAERDALKLALEEIESAVSLSSIQTATLQSIRETARAVLVKVQGQQPPRP